MFVEILYGVQIRLSAKSFIYRFFDYWNKEGIEIFYWNTDSIAMKEKDLDKVSRLKSKDYRYLNNEGMYNKDKF